MTNPARRGSHRITGAEVKLVAMRSHAAFPPPCPPPPRQRRGRRGGGHAVTTRVGVTLRTLWPAAAGKASAGKPGAGGWQREPVASWLGCQRGQGPRGPWGTHGGVLSPTRGTPAVPGGDRWSLCPHGDGPHPERPPDPRWLGPHWYGDTAGNEDMGGDGDTWGDRDMSGDGTPLGMGTEWRHWGGKGTQVGTGPPRE